VVSIQIYQLMLLMSDRLEYFVKCLKKGVSEGWDFVIIVDGREGSGKSTLAGHVKAIYDGKYNLEHTMFDAKTMLEEMQTAPRGSCVWVDETVLSLFKRESLTSFQVALVKAFSIIRARNLVFLLVLPNFNDLDPNIRNRAAYRLYAYAKKGVRGYVDCYQPQRSQWSTGSAYQELLWRYTFPQFPEEFQKEYDRFKVSGLDDAIEDLDKRVKDKIAAESSKKEWGRANTKLERLFAYYNDNPYARPEDAAAAVKCTLTYARQTAKTLGRE